MIIGIDFDNTIAWYEKSFREVALDQGFIDATWNNGGKTELRNYLRSLPNGEKIWMQLQGLVYGKYMPRAELMPGVANFLLMCKARNYQVNIISHKTVFGHFDPEKISLRQQAVKWMRNKGFFDPDHFGVDEKNVYFANTRKEKVEKIIEKKCDCFIDDLPEVFAEDSFPGNTKKILFGYPAKSKISHSSEPMLNWEEISDQILGPATEKDVATWSNQLGIFPLKEIEKVPGRGNSRIYRITTTDNRLHALKLYPNRLIDRRNRLDTEFGAITYLRANHIFEIPEALKKDNDLNIGVYSWVEGETIVDPGEKDLIQSIEFVKKLVTLSKSSGFESAKLATEACLSAEELIRQIEFRKTRLETAGDQPTLSDFLATKFSPLWAEIKNRVVDTWPISSFSNDLNPQYRVLSPSDFGFHNALKDESKITFIDFEYFGWDDPVKLTADFIWHPAMNLDSILAKKWELEMENLFSYDPDFSKRLNSAKPLYGLRWALILLNEFLPGFAERRKKAQNHSAETIPKVDSRDIQLKKATVFCERVKNLL